MADIKNRIGTRFEDEVSRTQGEAEGAFGSVVETVKETAQDVASGAANLAGRAKETAQEWASAAGDAAGQAGEKVQEAASYAMDRAGDFGQELTRLIRRNPVSALLISFGIGFLLARTLPRS